MRSNYEGCRGLGLFTARIIVRPLVAFTGVSASEGEAVLVCTWGQFMIDGGSFCCKIPAQVFEGLTGSLGWWENISLPRRGCCKKLRSLANNGTVNILRDFPTLIIACYPQLRIRRSVSSVEPVQEG